MVKAFALHAVFLFDLKVHFLFAALVRAVWNPHWFRFEGREQSCECCARRDALYFDVVVDARLTTSANDSAAPFLFPTAIFHGPNFAMLSPSLPIKTTG